MMPINDRAKPAFLALSCVGFIASATSAFAQDTATAPAPVEGKRLGGVTVTDTAIDEEVKVDNVSSPKSTAPLLDTPQTITVISNQTIRQQNLLTLRDALAIIPGITFGAGEGGGGFGDSINLRGYSANNDITQDGVRDSAQYSRTDPFNLQQIEVYNGANSVYNGSGSVGGTINLVSKVPQAKNLTVLEAGVGTDNYYRGTIDTNLRVSKLIAVRLNAMIHRNDYPGRDVEKYKRWGIAPSVTIGIDSPTRLTFSYFHQEDNNTPAYGVPFFITPVNRGPVPGVDRSAYYGIKNLDRQKITVDQATITFEHDFNENISVRNLTRWQRVHQPSRTSAPQGVFCQDDGKQPVTTAAGVPKNCAAPQNVPGTFYPSGPRGLVRDQLNQLLYNQTDLRVVSGEEGGIRNTLVVGASFTKEDYDIETASLLRNPDGSAVNPFPVIDISDPDTVYTGPINYTVTARSTSTSSSKAIYAFDNFEFGKFELNGGLRYENAKSNFRQIALTPPPPGTDPLTPQQLAPQKTNENLFSWRIGLVFKPTKSTTVYAAYANSKTPSSATVRLGCTSGSGLTFANFCDVAPEKARSIEIGVKANVLQDKLLLTAALFRNERTNFRVQTFDPNAPTAQAVDGRARVDGIALGATGKITPAWSIFANYTYLDSKILQSISDNCKNTTPLPNGCPAFDAQKGNDLVQTPKHSGSLWTTYLFPFGLQLGYGFTYQGSFATYQSNTFNLTQLKTKPYMTHRAMVAYSFDNGLSLQLNVQNLFNKKYFVNVRNNISATNGDFTGGWALPGEGRAARLSVYYSF
jgi:catecholate siderophore receptor